LPGRAEERRPFARLYCIAEPLHFRAEFEPLFPFKMKEDLFDGKQGDSVLR
jgi:hypothetical protein